MDMRGVLGLATLAFTGVIIADLVTNWRGVVAGGQVLTNMLAVTYTAMLGAPAYSGQTIASSQRPISVPR